MIEKAADIKGMRHLPTGGRRPGNHGRARQQRADDDADRAGVALARQGRQDARARFVSATERSKALPDVPTLKEKGFDLVYYLWVGLFAPKGTPAPIVSALAAAIDKAGASEQFKTAVANIGLEPSFQSAADFAKFWDEDARRAEDTIRRIGKVG